MFSKILEKNGKEYYNLDPAHHYSCTRFAWDAVLKMTAINLELITIIDMYQMVETGLLRARLGARKTGLSPPSIFILTVPRRCFCCGFLTVTCS